MPATITQKLRGSIVPFVILSMALVLILFLSTNWTTRASQSGDQQTDDAYLRADVTPLSTKAAGLVAAVDVSDYQPVKKGELLVRLPDDDFIAQVDQAQAALSAGESALLNNQWQKELQDARVQQATTGIGASEAEIAAAEAGIDGANSAINNVKSGMAGIQADVRRTFLERQRQEALLATESTTRQRLEQAVAEEQRFRALLAARESDIAAATAQLASRKADLERARAHLQGSRAEWEAQRRQHSLLDSQEQLLRADLSARRAALALARANFSLHADSRSDRWDHGGTEGPRGSGEKQMLSPE
jgi:membrane fusion protein (multidrug efflux system)